MKRPIVILTACALASLYSCHWFKKGSAPSNSEVANMHNAYDDSTLTNRTLPVMMPYNRLIDPAGKVIRFGSPNLENHSLDAKLIPGTSVVAVEDRYGITLIDTVTSKVSASWTYNAENRYKGLMSTYSGLAVKELNHEIHIFWSAAGADHRSLVFDAVWRDGEQINIKRTFEFKPEAPSPLALPNEVAVNTENGVNYLYVVLNGNNKLVKIDLNNGETVWSKSTGVAPYGLCIANGLVFVTNWGGPEPTDAIKDETAGVPYGSTYTDPKTGATLKGSVSVFNPANGELIKEIPVGLHPNAVISSRDEQFVYVANANSDNVSVIDTRRLTTAGQIRVQLMADKNSYIGDSPNALAISEDGTTLYVANGFDNAIAIVKLGAGFAVKGDGQTTISGFIPTEAYPGGILLDHNTLFVTNLEGEGSRVSSREFKNTEVPEGVTAYNSHHQKATVSIIPVPDEQQLKRYTEKVKALNLTFREEIAQAAPRKNVPAKPVPERIGEPSVFKHVLYIIKENRTYDQILGDVNTGNGMPSLCIFGENVTPNQHQLARNFVLMDNYHASGKCSAEGHQWTDAAMVTDYVEKNVRAWFRSYPHVQNDALVYDSEGFIWNNAADHGKTVKIFGEASTLQMDKDLTWSKIYENYQKGIPLKFRNTSTISRVRPILSETFPASYDFRIPDEMRADAFEKELKEYEKKPGDQLPQLMVMALSLDHTEGTRPGFPKPASMVADNDLALGKIIEAVTKSKFWKNTVIFVTEDDSQNGWDHVSAYRTTGFVVSPYSRLQRTVSTNYNQTCMVRTIEQILGIPPMNIIDATALPMFNCFSNVPSNYTYTHVPNKTPLNDLNPALGKLKGWARYYAKASLRPEYDHVDGGDDDLLNRIIWFSAKGHKPYPTKLAGKNDDDGE